MNIVAAIIDYQTASVSEREIFACGTPEKEAIYCMVKETPDILGAVLLSTCNRTELYFSLSDGIKEPDPFRVLCDSLGLASESYGAVVKRLYGEEAFHHICMLTSGATSQLLGDSQIITQVSDALAEAQSFEATDANLNTLFRLGVTAGKKIRTDMNLQIRDTSTADQAVKHICDDQTLQKILVVGNGTIGRLVAEKLVRAGRTVTMTLRQYHHTEAIIPFGVSVIPYDERYTIMPECDAVVSTTASPHIVIHKEPVERMEQRPKLMIDMAIPRDIEPEVGALEGVRCLNIDELSDGPAERLKQEQMETLNAYIEEYSAELQRWEEQRLRKEADVLRLSVEDRSQIERRHFPLFIDSMDRRVVVIGGGNIAERRILTLAEFGFVIRVISRSLGSTLQKLVDAGVIEWRQGQVVSDQGCSVKEGFAAYSLDQAAEDAWAVLACTNDRHINREVGRYCREKDLLVNVCDARNESTFWFPAVGLSDELTMGLVGKGTDHMNVKKAAAKLREVIEKKEYK